MMRPAHGWAPPIGRIAHAPRVRPLNERLWTLIEREHANDLTAPETAELNALCRQLEDEPEAISYGSKQA